MTYGYGVTLSKQTESSYYLSKKFLNIFLGTSSIIMLAAFSAYWFIFPLTPGRIYKTSAELIDHLVFWRWLTRFPEVVINDSMFIAIWIIASSAVAYIIYAAAAYLCWNREPSDRARRIIMLSAMFYYGISLFALPNFNTDIYNYITRARVFTANESNPHYISADNFPDDPLYRYANHRYTYLVGDKLAMWSWLSFLPSYLAGDNPVMNLLAFRVLFFLANCLNLFLIAAILRKLNPRYLLAGLVLYAWHPTVVAMGQTKTDTIMVTFLLLGIYAFLYHRNFLAVGAFTVSAFIKFITFPVLGIFLFRNIRREKWPFLLKEGLLALSIIFLINFPFWQDSSMFESHIRVILGEAIGGKDSLLDHRIVIMLGTAFLMGLGWLQNGEDRRFLLTCGLLMLLLSFFVLRISYAWYHISFIVFFSILGNRWIAISGAAFTCMTSLFTNWYIIFGRQFPAPEIFSLFN